MDAKPPDRTTLDETLMLSSWLDAMGALTHVECPRCMRRCSRRDTREDPTYPYPVPVFHCHPCQINWVLDPVVAETMNHLTVDWSSYAYPFKAVQSRRWTPWPPEL